jgi:hypothetical protein
MTQTVDIVNIRVYVDIVNTGPYDEETLCCVSDPPALTSLPMLEVIDRFSVRYIWLRIEI